MHSDCIFVHGARQNNLKNLDLELPLGELVVVTGVSGSGKSSLAFDTIYAEGQRRYVETFSPYARQFLDRMDKPQVDRIDGIPPAIAIDQTNPVRTSRSTVGTMTELTDHLKLLFARGARLYCRRCGGEVRQDTPETIATQLLDQMAGRRALITFEVRIPEKFSLEEIKEHLAAQGYTRIHRESSGTLEVLQDRVILSDPRRDRLVESLEAALRVGHGRLNVIPLADDKTPQSPLRFSAERHCAQCDIFFSEPQSNLFSFNSPIGACDTCRGFGRTMGIDPDLVIPDESRSLFDGAVKPWQSESYRECQQDLIKFADQRGIPVDIPWCELSDEQRAWVMEGEGEWEDGVWYGVKRFFDWLEGKSYKMHIRVLLSKYRSYDLCPDCGGARLKDEALLWRIGSREDADAVLAPQKRFRPAHLDMSDAQLQALPGLTLHDIMRLPIDHCLRFFESLQLPSSIAEAVDPLLGEIRTRLRFLVDVGLAYLTLDRQSRTLSGGEVQRINLTTALGTSLVNTLFVLDEPSIGLHPRDMNRVIGVLHRLRDAGNSLLVVEHDPQVMWGADRIIDMGPGPGKSGGQIVFNGSPQALLESGQSLTAQYLCGEKTVAAPSNKVPEANAPRLIIEGAAAHNLKEVDARIPLQCMVVVTGVSGSGKSTLVQDVLYNALSKIKGRPVEPAGAHRAIHGHEEISEVVLIDQSPIGRTTRSNPASYVGAFDGIRAIFADQLVARERGYTSGTFSFNTGNGRCPTCGGNGFEHVEMQFLSDVYLRCPDCDGRRFRPEILEIKVHGADGGAGKSIADVLEMTIAEALDFFADRPEVLRGLEPLEAVGLDYLSLGQPVPTLSGGEAQRLKLAGHLSATQGRKKKSRKGMLFLFDEPTTGLHFDDIARLLKALRRLQSEGHSLLIIEHNLDVIAAADWLIDLGPEGGESGGRIICAGSPLEVMECTDSHTGLALRQYIDQQQRNEASARSGKRSSDQGEAAESFPPSHRKQSIDRQICVHGAREHNLKGVDVCLPRDAFTVVTGVSGSGKSTLAFDILFAEGQRRYLESLNAYARQFVQPSSRPDIDALSGIPPTVAIEQRTSRGGRKSTVATLTEIYHFLRLLFVKLGVQYCPECNIPIEPQSHEAIVARLLRDFKGQEISLLAPLVVGRKGYYTDLAKWAAGKGFSHLRVDGVDTPTDNWPRLDRFREHNIDLPAGDVKVTAENEEYLRERLHRALDYGKGVVKVALDGSGIQSRDTIFSTRRACPDCGRGFEEPDPRLFSFNSKHGWCESCYGTGLRLAGFDEEQSGEEIWWNAWYEGEEQPCPACRGTRLRPEALAVLFRGHNIAELTALSIIRAEEFFSDLSLKGREADLARDIVAELESRFAFLREVGLSYLGLDRAAPTLSGGEAQRIRLAAQLGSNLRGVCYILDEPTIGLHPRDNRMLLDTLEKLEQKGNTIVVVEHDDETIRRAGHVIDLGPAAGVNGGRIVAEGTVDDLMAAPESVTGQFLRTPLCHPLHKRRRVTQRSPHFKVKDARLHNLKGFDLRLPLERLVCVTGVSGSGKSTLVRSVIHDNLRRILAQKNKEDSPSWSGCSEIKGWNSIHRILEVDQTPIGKTPRSCPATYVGFWDDVRKLFAGTAEAKMRGWGPGRFSFNTRDGRCPDCEGQGTRKIEMSFLPDVRIVCETCSGQRFTRETLSVTYKDKHIGDVLKMTINQAAEFFSAHKKIHHALRLLQDVGLGYLTLGQQSPTLSGGEAQRIKLVTELAKAPANGASQGGSKGSRKIRGAPTLYILDEPTIGLHMADVEKLIRVLHRLVDAGNTVLLIEHNLDIIAEADWLIDMGPEGGEEGGSVVAQGTPELVSRKEKESHTARILAEFLKERKNS